MNQADFDNKWIGTGMQMTKPFNANTGGIVTNTGADRLHQSIFYILSTIPGERFFLPEFGSKLYLLLFEPNDYILRDMIQVYVKEALDRWEPRITVLSVEVQEEDDNIVPVVISFRIKATNMVDNYVYPFRREAMPLGGELNYE
ncbi:MAG: GPW/gp25 family protein [Lachnospiraceae bacterium]|nr:GPW/gp25 family protein [Lachnospiraceae bacterium]